MAAAFLRKLSPSTTVLDAGSQVGEKEGLPIHEVVIQSMKEAGFDLSHCV